MQEPGHDVADGATRAGFVALVGRPNVGKSTLLNAFLGDKLSIVSARPQTTREPVTGLVTEADYQLIFVDTPGLLEPRYALQRSMQEQALSALADADVVLLLLDATRPDDVPTGEALEALRAQRPQLLVVANKTDAAAATGVEAVAAWCRTELGIEPLPIAAATGDGIDALRSQLVALLPPNPFFYPADEIAVQPVRFFVAELVRETIFEEYEEEIPYATVVRIEEFREGSEPLYIRATIYVERESQKGIIVGRGGAAIRRLGERSRAKVETFLGTPVYLDLWVKALPGWRAKPSALQYLGYRPPSGTEPDPQSTPAASVEPSGAEPPPAAAAPRKRGARRGTPRNRR